MIWLLSLFSLSPHFVAQDGSLRGSGSLPPPHHSSNLLLGSVWQMAYSAGWANDDRRGWLVCISSAFFSSVALCFCLPVMWEMLVLCWLRLTVSCQYTVRLDTDSHSLMGWMTEIFPSMHHSLPQKHWCVFTVIWFSINRHTADLRVAIKAATSVWLNGDEWRHQNVSACLCPAVSGDLKPLWTTYYICL